MGEYGSFLSTESSVCLPISLSHLQSTSDFSNNKERLTSKLVLYTPLLNTQQSGAILCVVAIEKGAFWSPTLLFTYIFITKCHDSFFHHVVQHSNWNIFQNDYVILPEINESLHIILIKGYSRSNASYFIAMSHNIRRKCWWYDIRC